MKNASSSQTPARIAGFTKIDLVAILAVVAVLVSLQVRLQADYQSGDEGARCLFNLRQFTTAWLLYAADNDNGLPAAGRRANNNPPDWTNGQWLDLPVLDRAEIDPYEPPKDSISGSVLWDYGVGHPATWRCPSDKSVGWHAQYLGGRTVPRVRSYGLNLWNSGGPRWDNSGWQWRVHMSLDDFTLMTPRDAFTFLCERADGLNDGYYIVDMAGFDPEVGLSLRANLVDFPAPYHEQGGNFAFVDGHVAPHSWNDPRTMPPVNFQREIVLNVPSPENPDVYWLQYHSTREE